MPHKFPRHSKNTIKALKALGYTAVPGKGDHTKLSCELPCADKSPFRFSFPVDRGTLPPGTFSAILDQAGGLAEEQLRGAIDGTFTAKHYRALVASKSREELLRVTRGRRFAS